MGAQTQKPKEYEIIIRIMRAYLLGLLLRRRTSPRFLSLFLSPLPLAWFAWFWAMWRVCWRRSSSFNMTRRSCIFSSSQMSKTVSPPFIVGVSILAPKLVSISITSNWSGKNGKHGVENVWKLQLISSKGYTTPPNNRIETTNSALLPKAKAKLFSCPFLLCSSHAIWNLAAPSPRNYITRPWLYKK